MIVYFEKIHTIQYKKVKFITVYAILNILIMVTQNPNLIDFSKIC